MYKSFLVLVFLALFGSYSDYVAAQATRDKSHRQTNIKNPIDSISLVMPASKERNAEAKELYREGMKLTEAGEFSQAVGNLQQALRLDPEYADAYAALGRAYFKMREWEKALVNLRRAAELNTKQRAPQDALSRKLLTQELKEAGTPASPQIKQEANARAAAVKPLHPESETTPETEQPEEASTPAKATLISPQVKPLQETNAGVTPATPEPETTRPREQRQEVGTPALAPTSPQITLSQETNGNGAGVKPTTPESETTRPPEPEVGGVPPSRSRDGNELEQRQEPESVRVAMSVAPASTPLKTNSVSPISIEPKSDETSLTRIYRVGPSDVLDIRLNDSESPQSTLFTVTPSGLLEHPILPEPMLVTGLTAEEIGAKIELELSKRSLPDNPKVAVGVRDYASHTILVSGLVKDSGTKFLRREAIPLYVVVADAQPLPEAARVTVVRNELNQMYEIDLTLAADMNLLVRPGDVITLHRNVTQFIYIGGDVKFPGEKTYRRRLTLMQAIIAAGGVTPKSKVAEIGRDDGQGLLVGTHFNLKDIQSGKAVDPLLKPGDRIMVLR